MEKKHKDQFASILKGLETSKEELEKASKNAAVDIGDAATAVTELKDELQEKFDDMSEKAQEGDKGTELEELIGELDSLEDELTTLKDNLEGDSPFDEVITSFNNIKDK